MKKIYLLISALFLLGLSSCFDMDKFPEGELSSVNPFTGTTEIKKYLNQFYESSIKMGDKNITNSAIRPQSNNVGSAIGITFGDLNSDNMQSNAIDTRLAGKTALSSAAEMTEYKHIRSLNFLIKNLDNCIEVGPEMDQCVGEAYFFRACYYYRLLVNYGGVTWLTEVLDPIQEQMERPRDGRIEIADNILADLDIAIEKLNAQKNSATMRVHKDVARALKSEVALFEGTWEKYHKAKNTPFYDKKVTDEKITSYLRQSADAAKAVIDEGSWSIYMGDPNTAYRDLFITLDLSNNPEVLWWKKYDAANNIGHSVTRFLNKGGGTCGASASLVDDYLTKEGKPLTGIEREQAKIVYGDELRPDFRDPRLSQTICMPGQDLRPNGKFVFKYPPLDEESYNQNTTGYSIFKYIEYNTAYVPTIDGEGKSQAPAIQFRYADILLNYAEALAELDGAGNAGKIKETLKPLRERVGMPELDFDREYNTAADYPFKNLDKYTQAVRRERRVEKALEGSRLQDILRWAAADLLIIGKTPTGALFKGSSLENAYEKGLTEGENLFLTGTPSDTRRYIIPFNNVNYPDGWEFNPKRDYLLPIQPRMLSLTGNQWEQNPGW